MDVIRLFSAVRTACPSFSGVNVVAVPALDAVDGRSAPLAFFVIVSAFAFTEIPAPIGVNPVCLNPVDLILSLEDGILTMSCLVGVDASELLSPPPNLVKSIWGMGGVADKGELALLPLDTLTRAGFAFITATALSRTTAEAMLVRARLGVTLFLGPLKADISV